MSVTHGAAPAAPVRLTFPRIALFGLAVFALLLYSGGWELPVVGENATEAGSTILRVAYLPAYAAGFALIALRPGASFRVLIRQPFLLILLAVAVASTFWSVNPDQTVRRCFALVCTTLGGAALAARFRWPRLAEVVGASFAVLIVACFVVCLAVPRIGVMTELFPGAWRGLWREKNGLGGIMAFGFCILSAAALLNPRRARLWWTFAGLAVVLVLMSTSKTSLVSLMLGVGAIGFVLVARRGPAAGAAATWAGVTGVVLLTAFILFAADVFFAILGKDATLTGRTKIWAAVMREVQDRPWLGYGYQAVWGDKSGWGPFAWISKNAGFQAQHAHNSWLEQWLGMGLVGVIAWGLFYLQTMTLAVIAVFRDRGGALLAFPFLVVYSLVALTESIAVTYNDFRWVLFVAFATKLAFPDREVEA
ncbi:lipid A core-O-antigen ligase-like enyme [Caulobacter sp. AP07]|uniref:O-antigen ligase family protein n=1 Tax=Caulobacter sp. AP07 TaxID=1144304 RepID=UPI000272116C|nr:O-antigen ligase [Caulobacter sp. AP07]EJL29616.1 lipid A core-O-antigen ligase-like enyme [Caulobacter sp. AP07]